MYIMNFISLMLVLTTLSLPGLTACRKPPPIDKSGKEYTSAYVCPMHCKGSGSDTTGTCPICGMEYIPSGDSSHEGHKH
jgi:hypothetical protein